MNGSKVPDDPQMSKEEMTSAMFANMVAQQTNMALMFLGRVPHPESGQPLRDLNSARMFIDQLEMLEVKTKGNLDKEEQHLLQQSLTVLRMAFVEAVNEEAPAAQKKAASPDATAAAANPGKTAEPGREAATEPAASPAEAESHKKFSKKY